MARLDHPNIVQFCDADQHESTCYFAMEYVDGIDMGKHIRLSGPCAGARGVRLHSPGGAGLAARSRAQSRPSRHQAGQPVLAAVVRGPASVAPKKHGPGPASATDHGRRTKSYCVKILDWGLAEPAPSARRWTAAARNAVQGVVGTADYLSPEQARNAMHRRHPRRHLQPGLYVLLPADGPAAVSRRHADAEDPQASAGRAAAGGDIPRRCAGRR